MAGNNNRDVRLNIGVATSGLDQVQALGDSIEGIGEAGSAAAPAAARLAAELTAAEAATRRFRETEAAARSEAGQQKRTLDDQRDALARLRAESDKATRATDEFKAAERAQRLAVIDARAALRDKQETVRQAASATRDAIAAEQGLTRQLGQTTAALRAQGQQASATAAQQDAATRGLSEGLRGVGDQLRTIQGLAVAALGGSLLGGVAGEVAQTADAYANLAARIRLVTGEGAAFESAFGGVFEVAQRTGTAVEETGNLFVRIAQAGRALGVSQQQALALTESIGQATQLSGASAQASSASIAQFVQALQSGVLRGEEFNSVMEQNPRLAQALAAGLSVTTGELRKLAEAGSLTSSTVIGALQGQSAALQAEFEQLPATIGRSVQALSNAWTQYVGEVDKANGVSSIAAQAIQALAANLDTLGALLYSAGKAALAYQALKLAATFTGIGTAARTAAVEIAAVTAAQTASGVAGAGAAAGVGKFGAALAGLRAFTLIGIATNFQEIGTAIGEGTAKLFGYGKALENLEIAQRADEQAARASAAARAQLAQQTALAADQALGLDAASRKLIGSFAEVTTKGGTTTEALEKVSKALELGDISGITSAGAALDALAVRGQLSAQQVREAWVAGLKAIDLGTFEAQARAAFDGSEQGARRLKAALDGIATESLRRAGTSAEELASGFSAAATSAINDVDALAKSLDSLGVTGDDAGRALAAALNKATDAAGTERAVRAVVARFEELGKQGRLSGEEIAAGLEKARQKLDNLQPGIRSLDDALRAFGLKSKTQLDETAANFASAWERIRTSTTTSLADKARAFETYRQAAVAANGGVESSEIRVTAEMLRMQGAATTTGDVIERSMDRAGQRVAALGERIAQTAGQIAKSNKLAADGGENQSVLTKGTVSYDDNTGLDSLLSKKKAGTLDEGDEATARATLAAAKATLDSLRAAQQVNAGAITSGVVPQVEGYVRVAQQILDEVLQAKGNQSKSAAGSSGGGGRTVNINLNGRRTSIGVDSAADARALEELLRQLGDAAGRSG